MENRAFFHILQSIVATVQSHDLQLIIVLPIRAAVREQIHVVGYVFAEDRRFEVEKGFEHVEKRGALVSLPEPSRSFTIAIIPGRSFGRVGLRIWHLS